MIPRSRKIVVDGHLYQWSLPAHRPRYHWDEPTPPKNGATLTVQASGQRPGRVAQVSLTWNNGDRVTPDAVAIIIRRFLAAGWGPSERGAAFLMDGVDLAELDTKDNVARSVMES
jgi:hypothetical protein